VLRFLRRGQRWLTGLIVAGVGVVFVFFMGWGAPTRGGPGGPLAEVGSYRFGTRDFERVRAQREDQMRKLAGDQFNAEALRQPLDDFAIRQLVDTAILALEAERLGLAVSNQEIEQLIVAGGGFQDANGQFDRKRFRGYVEYEFGTERNFLTSQRLALLAGKMVEVIYGLARVSDAEARESLRMRLEAVRLAYVAFEPSATADAAAVPPERVQAFLKDREGEARALYDSRKDVYDVPEQVRARHILVRVPRGADEATVAAAKARAEAILARVRGGEDFAAVARETSDDPGSKQAGGDLGLFPRGHMVPAFEEVAFSLEPGAISDVVRTDFGFHVIQVQEHLPAHTTPFAEVREALAAEILATEVAREQAQATAERLSQAISNGTSLEDAARAEKLTLERTDLLRRRPDGFVPGLGAAPDLLATAFALEPGESSPRIFDVGKKLALIEVLERKPPEQKEIDSMLDSEREKLLTAKRNAELEAWLAVRRDALREDGDLKVNMAAIPR
jgi:peptidyl-prolyl cis-trans isomerase D